MWILELKLRYNICVSVVPTSNLILVRKVYSHSPRRGQPDLHDHGRPCQGALPPLRRHALVRVHLALGRRVVFFGRGGACRASLLTGDLRFASNSFQESRRRVPLEARQTPQEQRYSRILRAQILPGPSQQALVQRRHWLVPLLVW